MMRRLPVRDGCSWDSSPMQQLLDAIEVPSPAGIAAAIGRLITAGRLAPGDRLPTVRELAGLLGVSPATVSSAWQALSAAGLIVSRGRSGTFVLDAPRRWLPARSQVMAGRSIDARVDLSRGTPDPDLLPALGPALARVSRHAKTDSYLDLPVIPELHAVLNASWPYPVEAITVVDGALDALSRSLEQVTRFGDRVIVESPGISTRSSTCSTSSASNACRSTSTRRPRTPASLPPALKRSPSAVILQPRAHNPTGASMTPSDRAEELAGSSRPRRRSADTIVIEDDHSAEISTARRCELRVPGCRSGCSTSAATRSRTAPTCASPPSVDRPRI
jgi:DNA-binding transcriptional MocR family regulator